MIGDKERRPALLFPPGVFIREELEARGMTVRSLALQMHYPPDRIQKVVYGVSRITPVMARNLGRAFGTSAEMWLNLQRAWDERGNTND